MDSKQAATTFIQRQLRPGSLTLILTALLLATAAHAQTAPPDSQLNQSMLAEIRQLRQDLQTAAATIQRVQIVMYRLQTQTSAVSEATQRRDEAQQECGRMSQQREYLMTEIEQADERARSAQNPVEKQSAQAQAAALRNTLTTFNTEAQLCPARQAAAETQLRTEQAKKEDLEAQLDRLDKLLAALSTR
jgi:chromosome segregation ATPase